MIKTEDLDGSKRLGWLAVVVFLGLNGVDVEAPDHDAYDLVIAVATGQKPLERAATILAAWH